MFETPIERPILGAVVDQEHPADTQAEMMLHQRPYVQFAVAHDAKHYEICGSQLGVLGAVKMSPGANDT